MGIFGNKSLGRYPNGVPYDKRRYNPHHPHHLRPPRNSPEYGYPADAWMTRAPYSTTLAFRLSQHPAQAMNGPGMGDARGIGSNAGAGPAFMNGPGTGDARGIGSNAGAGPGTAPMNGPGMGDARGIGSNAGAVPASMNGAGMGDARGIGSDVGAGPASMNGAGMGDARGIGSNAGAGPAFMRGPASSVFGPAAAVRPRYGRPGWH